MVRGPRHHSPAHSGHPRPQRAVPRSSRAPLAASRGTGESSTLVSHQALQFGKCLRSAYSSPSHQRRLPRPIADSKTRFRRGKVSSGVFRFAKPAADLPLPPFVRIRQPAWPHCSLTQSCRDLLTAAAPPAFSHTPRAAVEPSYSPRIDRPRRTSLANSSPRKEAHAAADGPARRRP